MKKRELNTDPTDFVIRGLGEMLVLLQIYGARRGVPAKALAMKLWPRSTGWTNERSLSLRHRGKGLTYAATNLLVRLQRMGLAEEAAEGYRLTGQGLITALDAGKKEKR